jgi:hypothetical protein
MMDGIARNPFHELYLSEMLRDQPWLYIDLFSSEILTGETQSLFRPGNVVLLGSNGAGKTMLLGLLSPEVRAAFLKQDRPYPVSEDESRSLGVGINFVHAGFNHLAQRRVHEEEEQNLVLWSLMMGDLLNYSLVWELFKTLQYLGSDSGAQLRDFLGAKIDEARLDEFALEVAKSECWHGYLERFGRFEDLLAGVRERVFVYKAFANWNQEKLPDEILATKTEMGSPLARCRSLLEKLKILGATVHLTVTFDQYETLIHLDYATVTDPERSIGRRFCRVVNSFLAARSPKVSYKLGVRPYSWGKERRVLGSDAHVEAGRDFQVVNLDEILRRRENTGAWIFPRFARDVAKRRMEAAGVGVRDMSRLLAPLTPERELEYYCGRNEERLIPNRPKWPEAWRALLRKLYRESKFESRLAEIWIIQRMGREGDLPEHTTVGARKRDWRRPWWQKERREALLMQAASDCRQRRLYGGWEVVMTLSASNILIFLSLCREIWDIWERAQAKSGGTLRTIGPEIQSQAIRVVADSWLRGQESYPGGPERSEFITRLGIGIRRALLADKGLVYPGHTGFSLLKDDYESTRAKRIREFLDGATDFGALICLPHTTKERDRRQRLKWYLCPTVCPHFDIPAIRTKEPYYATLDEVATWLSSSRPQIEFRLPGQRRPRLHSVGVQPLLFENGGDSIRG